MKEKRRHEIRKGNEQIDGNTLKIRNRDAISQPDSTRKAGFRPQVALAEAVGYSYEEFLNFGRRLLPGEEPIPPDNEKPSGFPMVVVVSSEEKKKLPENPLQ